MTTTYAKHDDWMLDLSKMKVGDMVQFNRGPLRHDDIVTAVHRMRTVYQSFSVTNHGDSYTVMRVFNLDSEEISNSDKSEMYRSAWNTALDRILLIIRRKPEITLNELIIEIEAKKRKPKRAF